MAPAPTKKGTKRAAPSFSDGPAAKKKRSAAPRHEKGVQEKKKRAQPVVPMPAESDESDLDDEDARFEEVPMDHDEDEEAEGGDDEMQVDGQKPKNPNAARESRKAQSALHAERRAAKPHAALLADAKAHWALVRQKSITKEERQKHITALMDAVRGHVQEIVFKHDASRIIQTIVKWAGQPTRNEIADELKGRYKELAQNKYSKFLVTKLARLCPSRRESIVLELKPSVLRLILHREASRVLADIYELYASAYERSLLVRELYGRETALFSSKSALDDKDITRAGLQGVLKDLDVEQQKRVLKSVKTSIQQVFDNPDKGSVRHALVHRVIWEYLSALLVLPDAEEASKLRGELLENALEQLAELVHTKDGSRAVRELLARGDAKQRKSILKALKPYVETMAKDDEAQLVLFSIMDIVDDTKLVAKSIVAPITAAASTLHTTGAGRRALLYPLVPRNTRYFTPALSVTLAETDPIRATTSKKDTSVRANEVRAAASPEMLAWIAKDGASACEDTGGSLLLLEIMLNAEGDKGPASESLLKHLAASYSSDAEKNLIDEAHVARMHKALLQGGHFSRSKEQVEQVDKEKWDAGAYAASFVRILGKEQIVGMARGGGAFVVAELLERAREQGDQQLKGTLKAWFDDVDVEETEEVRGWAIVCEKLKALRET